VTRARPARVAGMATMPSRAGTAPQAIASIVRQVDALWVFLDRFESVPAYAQHEKIVVLRSEEHGDLRGNGKFLRLALDDAECTSFGVDDDIEYPADYVEVMEAHLRRFAHGALVGVHASALDGPPGSYELDRKVLHFRSAQRVPVGVDVLGTGTVAFASTTLRFDVRTWKHVNTLDLLLARAARERAIPLVMVPRQGHWLDAIAEGQSDSTWSSIRRDDALQTQLARELMSMPRPRLPRDRLRRLSYRNA
jgi:hypothetical protein